MKKALQIASYLTILIALLVLGVIIFWLVYPYKIADFNNLPFPVLNENKVVERGDRLRYKLEFCKYTDQMPQLRKFLVDGVVYELLDTVGIATKGCNEIETDVYIPRNIPTGEYYLRTIAEYKVNPIRTITIINYTENFFIE